MRSSHDRPRARGRSARSSALSCAALMAVALCCGMLTAAGAIGLGDHAKIAGTAAAGAARTAAPSAHAARTLSLDESGRLHMTSKHGFTLNEQGSASGTIPGPIYVHLSVVSTNRVTAEVNIYPSGGSISGQGSASYLRGTTTASFSGSMTIGRGSGSYAHAHGSGLSFSGTIQRSNDAVTVHVSGRVSD
jgi:hypothetical protein